MKQNPQLNTIPGAQKTHSQLILEKYRARFTALANLVIEKGDKDLLGQGIVSLLAFLQAQAGAGCQTYMDQYQEWAEEDKAEEEKLRSRRGLHAVKAGRAPAAPFPSHK
jgi:hypothetical protein